MNYDSVLNGSAMAGQCREMASRLKQEIDFYSFEISAINTFIESKASGEAATALKNKAEKLIQMLQIAISANEYDIHDCNILAEMVDGITIDGYEVLTRKQEARNNAEECYNQAAYYSRVASECIISSIGNHFYELANTYRGYAVSWERIEDALHKIENQYDDIDYDSSILFKDGYDTRCLLDNEEYDVVLLDCSIPAGVTKGGNTIAKDSDTKSLNRDELSDEELMTKYWFLYEHLKKLMNPSADDEEIFDAMRNINDKMPLVNFWATYHFSQNDYQKLVDILDRDYFVKEQIDVLNMYLEINNLIWTEDEKQKVLEEYYKKYAPKDDYDCSMFAAGVELVVGKDVFIVEWDKCQEIYSVYKKRQLDVFKYDWKKSEYVDDEFLLKVIDIAERLGTNPDDLMAIMAFESNGINPYCENDSGYFGLIQFGDMAIQTINSKYECNYTKEEILSMTPTEQLEVVYMNFAWQLRDKSQKYTLSDLYMTVIWPDAVEKEDDYILFTDGDNYYKANSGLDINEDGIIRKGETIQKIIEKREEYKR